MKTVICLILSLVLALTTLTAASELRASAAVSGMAQMDHAANAGTSAECVGCDPAQADRMPACEDGCPVNCMAGGLGACTLGAGLTFLTAPPNGQAQSGESPRQSGMTAPPDPFPPRSSL